MSAGAQLLIFIAIIVVFWLVLIRPQRNQQRAMRDVQRGVEVGDEVIISAGIFGTVRSVEEAKVELEIAPGTVITVARQVVVRRAEDVPADADADSSVGDGAAEDDAGTHTDPDTDVEGNPVDPDQKSE